MPATTSTAIDLIWIDQGLMAFSPMAAPIATIQALDIAYAGRWQFWAIMSCWCLLAWASAGAMYWAALRSFDRRLGRMRETSQGAGDIEPPEKQLSRGRSPRSWEDRQPTPGVSSGPEIAIRDALLNPKGATQ